MTSSEPPLVASGVATAPSVVLAQGHLHPAILLLKLIDALRNAAFAVVFGIVFERWFLVVAAVLFLGHLGHALIRYLTFQYTLTPDELVTREGILERQERRIPVDRIQDLGFESTLLRRVLGLVVVAVETAAGKGAEATLDSLDRSAAERLREVLLATRQQRAAERQAAVVGVPVTAPVVQEPEWTVLTASTGDLLLRGFTDLRVGAILVSGFASLQLADSLGLAVRLRGVADSFFDWVRSFPFVWVVVALVGLVVAVMVASVVMSALGNLVMFHGFRLTLRGDVLQRRYGLLTTRSKTLPRRRVQRVTVEQTWLRRLLGLAVVKADSAGQNRAAGDESTGGWDIVVPMARLDAAFAALPALVVGIERAQFAWRRASPRLIGRYGIQGALLAALALAVAMPLSGPWGLLALLLLPVWFLIGVLSWGNLAWACDDEVLALRFGILGRYVAFVPAAKVQSAVARRSPLQRLFGLGDLTVYVAGGSPSRLPDLVKADIVALQARLAARAAASAANDWRRTAWR
ncbi:MAG: PH domain-containing protein [Planctomycetes bacterium]|nr:PH domain-containing protein [Planctomycetota bacterium]